VAPTLTLAQRQANKVNGIKRRNLQLQNDIITILTANWNDVWNDPDQANFSPQQVFSLFGSDAGPLCAASYTLVTLVNGQTPGSLPAATPQALTVNADNTVTVAPAAAPTPAPAS
jgi:hypothetical protein